MLWTYAVVVVVVVDVDADVLLVPVAPAVHYFVVVVVVAVAVVFVVVYVDAFVLFYIFDQKYELYSLLPGTPGLDQVYSSGSTSNIPRWSTPLRTPSYRTHS